MCESATCMSIYVRSLLYTLVSPAMGAQIHVRTIHVDFILIGVSVLARVLTTCINRCLNPITLYGCFWFQFICQFCYKPYGSKQNMVFHLRAVHGVGGDPPRCKTCGRADFKSPAALCLHSKKCQKASK